MRTIPPTPEQASKADYVQVQSPVDNRAGFRPYKRRHVSLWDAMLARDELDERQHKAADTLYSDYFHCHGSPVRVADPAREVRGGIHTPEHLSMACRDWKLAYAALSISGRAVVECLIFEQLAMRAIEKALHSRNGQGKQRIRAALTELADHYRYPGDA